MKAVVINRHGGPEVLELTELPDPIINENEVLIRVKACALNHLDVWIRRGLKGVEFPMPHVLGCDIAGVVESVGRLVKNTRAGEEVMLSPGVSCMHCECCLSERDNQCASYDILGYRANGGYAEYVKAPSVNVLSKPKNLSFEEASSIPLVFLTAWHMLVDRVNLRPGETLLTVRDLEVRDRPALRGKPVIVGSPPTQRGRVGRYSNRKAAGCTGHCDGWRKREARQG